MSPATCPLCGRPVLPGQGVSLTGGGVAHHACAGEHGRRLQRRARTAALAQLLVVLGVAGVLLAVAGPAPAVLLAAGALLALHGALNQLFWVQLASRVWWQLRR